MRCLTVRNATRRSSTCPYLGRRANAAGGDWSQSQLILSRRVSPARTSVMLALAKVWEGSEAVFFSRSCAYPKKSSPRSFSLRTSPRSGREVRTWLAKNWPKEGMIVDGWLHPLRTLGLATKGVDGFVLLPTPTASDFGTSGNGVRKGKQKQRASLGTMARRGRWIDGHTCRPGLLNPRWIEWLMGLPDGWTDLEHWAMEWYLSKRGKRSLT